jgi:hypothetical protein
MITYGLLAIGTPMGGAMAGSMALATGTGMGKAVRAGRGLMAAATVAESTASKREVDTVMATKVLPWVRLIPTLLGIDNLPYFDEVNISSDGVGYGHGYGWSDGRGRGRGPDHWDRYGDGWGYGNGKGEGMGHGYDDH